MDSRQTLSLAVKHHQAGNLGEAETLYRRVLQAEPHNPDALHLLGVISNQLGKSDLAVDYIKQALRLHPGFPVAHNNLAVIYMQTDRLTEAEQEMKLAEKNGFRVNPQFKTDLKDRQKAPKGQ